MCIPDESCGGIVESKHAEKGGKGGKGRRAERLKCGKADGTKPMCALCEIERDFSVCSVRNNKSEVNLLFLDHKQLRISI